MRTRVSACLALVLPVLALAGCGSSGAKHPQKASQPPSASAEPQIKKVWTEFFSSGTPPSAKVALLQNGQRFAPVIEAQSKSPLAAHTSATVSEVTLTGPSTASVTYTILLAGKPALRNVKGTAVKANGKWQVGDQSFCALLKLQGTTPPGCPKA
jgi:predicted small lipoprotein YifL